MGAEATHRGTVREIALDRFRYVAMRHTADAGVSPDELPKLAAQIALESIADGLYRVTDILPSPRGRYTEVLLRVGDGTYSNGESVFILLSLTELNPTPHYRLGPRGSFPVVGSRCRWS